MQRTLTSSRSNLPKLFFLFTLCINLYAPGQAAFAQTYSYNVSLFGLDAAEFDSVNTSFKEASLLELERSKPLVSVANLQGRLKTDLKLLNRILRAEGYYNGTITHKLSRQDNHFTIEFYVTPGPLYYFAETKLEYQLPLPPEDMRLKLSHAVNSVYRSPAKAATVITTEAKLAQLLPQLGFPFAQPINRTLLVDHKTQTMQITFFLDTGQRRRFGTTDINGLSAIKESYIKRFIPWTSGDFFDQSALKDLQLTLTNTKLFAAINYKVTPTEEDRANVDIILTETQHRTISTSAGYSTSEGVSGEVSWEHRNFLSRGNWLKFIVRGAEIEQSISGHLEIPNFSRLNQTLSFNAAYRRQDTDAFLANTINTSAGIAREIHPKLALRTGLELEYSDITDTEGIRHFYIASLPIGLRWDSSDDLLDPTHGLRVSLLVAPHYGVDGKNFTFLKNELEASAYFPLMDNKVIFALRSRLGSITGTETTTLPATRRFYAGGGGSIRGFSFQQVGPLSADGTPLGGRSVSEFSAELRWRSLQNISFVPFIEGGNVYDQQFPTFSNLRWGAGIGMRYHTDIGPIRLDVAFPLNREERDSSFQIYISLGQAF